jgi:uncharacterized membrane protein
LVERLRKERRRFIQILLRATLTLSALLMLVGLSIWSGSHQAAAPAVKPGQLFSGLDQGDRLMLAGIVVLAITPALQVLALLLLWVRERAWRFVATSGLVLVLLGIAFWAGGG